MDKPHKQSQARKLRKSKIYIILILISHRFFKNLTIPPTTKKTIKQKDLLFNYICRPNQCSENYCMNQSMQSTIFL